MAFSSRPIEGTPWEILPLAESAILLRLPPATPDALDLVRYADARITELLQKSGGGEVVPAFDSIAIFLHHSPLSFNTLIAHVASLDWGAGKTMPVGEARSHEIPVCYDFGPDWDLVSQATGIDRDVAICLHAGAEYRVAMTGFMPGFVYLEGLPEALRCARRGEPRLHVPAGSVGIGGSHSGIYGLPTPGGWQLIGRTPLPLFDGTASEPSPFLPGDRVRFQPIDKHLFSDLQSNLQNGQS